MADKDNVIKNIMGKFTDDEGLFRGGQEGRMFGRAKDALEGKKNTIGHNIAMSLSGVPKEGPDSWQRDLDYEDLPEITKREGGIRGWARDIFGFDNKLGDYDALTKELRKAENRSDRTYNWAIDDHDRRRAELYSEYNQKRLKHAVETGDDKVRNEMLMDYMDEQNRLHWALNDGDLPESVRESFFGSGSSISDYKKHLANDPLRYANPTTMKSVDKDLPSGRLSWEHLNLKDFGFDVHHFKQGNLDEFKGLYKSLDEKGRKILMDHMKTTGQRYDLLEGDETPSDYARRMYQWGVDYTGTEAGEGFADAASKTIGSILNEETYDYGDGETHTPDIKDLVWQTSSGQYTKEGKAAFEERMRKNIEEAGY